MTMSARAYCAFVIAAGVAILCWSIPRTHFESPSRFAVYILCAALLATFKLRMPGMRATISGGSLVIFASMCQMTFGETVLIAAVSALSQCLWRSRTDPRWVQVTFSVATLIVSSAVTRYLCEAVAALTGLGGGTGVMFLEAAMFYVVNTSLIAAVLAVTELRPPLDIWRRLYMGTFPHYLALALVGGALSRALDGANWAVLLAAMPLAYAVNYQRLRAQSVLSAGSFPECDRFNSE